MTKEELKELEELAGSIPHPRKKLIADIVNVISMTKEELKELEELAGSIHHPHKKLIADIVNVMSTLRSMNVDAIDHMTAMHKTALQFMPDELKPAFEGMITDFVLIRAFIEQAKAYDKTVDGNKAFEAVFGEIKIEEGGDK